MVLPCAGDKRHPLVFPMCWYFDHMASVCVCVCTVPAVLAVLNLFSLFALMGQIEPFLGCFLSS